MSDLGFGVLGGESVRNAGAYLSELGTQTLRLGVTGLSRAGKTVFITALVRNLVDGGRLPFFRARAEGRVLRAYLEPQPDDAVPRFDIEAHAAALTGAPPRWPESTARISQLRLTIEYEPSGRVRRAMKHLLGVARLHVDIVDYPGEWLLDLAMLGQDYAEWSRVAIEAARRPHHASIAGPWLERLASLDPAAPADENRARSAAATFTAYLADVRAKSSVATLGPGRFLLPGELAGSPLLTFVPLNLPERTALDRDSLAAMMQRRYESYRREVVRPFFARHFGRLDRQIVLVDALAAIDGGSGAVEDLTAALTAAFEGFRPGSNSWLSQVVAPRIDRIVFAATKADHLPRTGHDRLEAALRLMVERAMTRASYAGADVKVLALAALRATREVEVRQGADVLPCIAGIPLAGERLDTLVFDGSREAVVFPGDLPADPVEALRTGRGAHVGIVKFAPPRLQSHGAGGIEPAVWPHVRLDRAIDFLIGDRLT